MKKLILTALVSASFFTSCTIPTEKKAKVIDSAVEGLEVQCAGRASYTPKDGSISCLHMPLALKLGEIKLGIIYDMPSDGIILPQDIVNAPRDDIKNENVEKLVVILQSLDSDHNPENGITITKETRDKLNTFVDLQTTSLEDLKDLIDAQLGTTNFTDKKSALEHLQRSMRKYNVNVPNTDLEGLE